ncbi:hypothetical protein RFI_13143 [Reticulomyxa filosa]|uniref:DUF1977 domain-containing protein n=1 Tax=Reticulomyxa filosa TaxID=46433 RepID=X6NFA0_RETFI|nr:hypothetical protein RFI_13143 [Reticulomyxa filosa]|eukprot:ETO24017.1 hypothetical protein RFI_13143 [Reticulomyxa filosa]
MQLFPLLIMIFSLLIPSLLSSGRSSSNGLFSSSFQTWANLEGNVYTLESQYPFDKMRKSVHGVTYFVSQEFEYRFAKSVSRVEDDVETKYLERMIHQCDEEKVRVDKLRQEILSSQITSERRMSLVKELTDDFAFKHSFHDQKRKRANKYNNNLKQKKKKKEANLTTPQKKKKKTTISYVSIYNEKIEIHCFSYNPPKLNVHKPNHRFGE